MNKTDNENKVVTLFLFDLKKGFLKFGWLCVALAVAFGGIMFLIGFVFSAPEYEASETFTIGILNGENTYSFNYDKATSGKLSEAFPYIIESNILKEIICEDLKLEELTVDLNSLVVRGSNLFTINAVGNDPQLTYDVLKSAMKNFPSVAKYVIGKVKLKSVTKAVLPEFKSDKSSYIAKTAAGFVAGLIIGLVWIVAYAMMRKTLRTKEEIREETGLETIGVIPAVNFKRFKPTTEKPILMTGKKKDACSFDAMRILKNTIESNLSENENVIMVTSIAPKEGKTTVALNLANSLSGDEKKVLVVDADLKNQSAYKTLKLKDENNIKVHDDDLYTIIKVNSARVDFEFLRFKSNSSEVFKIEKLKELFSLLKGFYDYIIVDSPALGTSSDSMIIAESVESIIFVVMQDTTRASAVKRVIEKTYKQKIVGCVLNGALSGYDDFPGQNKKEKRKGETI